MTFTPGKRSLYPFHGRWCVLLEHHLRRRDLSASAFARLTQRSQQSIHDYLAGKVRPPPDLVPVFADALGLKDRDRAEFTDAAWEPWTPEPVWKRLREAEAKATAGVERKPSEVEKEAARLRATIAEMVTALRDSKALFYDRTVPVHRISDKRAAHGMALARLIERHERPPADPEGPGSMSANAGNPGYFLSKQ